MSAQFDEATRKWFRNHITAQTTVVRCDQCGLYYKPILGHKCRKADIIKFQKEVQTNDNNG